MTFPLRDKFYPLSLLTVAWGGCIIASASFMRQVYNVSVGFIGRESISGIIWIMLLCMGGAILHQLIKLRLSIKYFVITVLIVGIALRFAWSMEIMEERVHIIKYGLLGFLAARDANLFTRQRSFLFALSVGASVGIVDEAFQWILPYRVGDLRDVVADIISAGLGAAVYLCIRSGTSFLQTTVDNGIVSDKESNQI